jgi:ABC-type uncharacterized transport system ATPase subunit
MMKHIKHPGVIETRALRKEFGATIAVADLSLHVGAGEIFGFFGPNGAGKTTSIKMLLALVEPTSGTGHVLGAPLGDRAARARIGFLPEHFRFHDRLTATELLRFNGRLYGLRGVSLDAPIDQLLTRVDLLDAAECPLRGYSKGMLQRVGLAQALLNDPQLVAADRRRRGESHQPGGFDVAPGGSSPGAGNSAAMGALALGASVPTPLMVWWAAGFTVLTLLYAVRAFRRRAL